MENPALLFFQSAFPFTIPCCFIVCSFSFLYLLGPPVRCWGVDNVLSKWLLTA